MPLRSLNADEYFLTGVLEPEDIGKVAQYAAQGKLLGASGLVIPHQMVNGYSADIRERIGKVLQLLPKVYMLDDLSVEWAPHLGISGEKGGDLNWLMGIATSAAGLVQDIEEAHAAVFLDQAMLILVGHKSDGWAKWTETGGADKSHLPLYRWAKEFGLLEAVRGPQDIVVLSEALAVPPSRKDVEVERARGAMVEMRKARGAVGDDVGDHIDTLFGSSSPKPSKELRRMEIGSVMDPGTHYDDHYYGVEGKGILYPKPDGSWDTYRGTAHYWSGNHIVARILTQIGLKGSLLDVGTGAGDFVGAALAAGFRAYGVDISDAAHQHALPLVRERLIVADVTDPEGMGQRGGHFDVMTAFDFWEHIFEEDVDRLIRGVRQTLKPGGVHVMVICTRGTGEEDQVFDPGVRVTKENGWVLVSGHVNVRLWGHWARRFLKHGFRLRNDLMNFFQVRRAEEPSLRGCESWSSRNLLIVDKK